MTALVEWARWPNLGGRHHPQLDWVVTVYEATKIRQMADAAEQGDWNPWTKATVEALRALADSAPALKALNHHGDKNKVLGLNRAVHFLVGFELRGEHQTKAIREEVANSWRCATETVRRDVQDHGVRARELIDELVTGLARAQGKSRADLLWALDKDMDHRAAHMAGES